MKVKPMGTLLMMLAGWLKRHQQDVMVCLKDEDKILRERLGTRRIVLSILQPLTEAECEPGTQECKWLCSKGTGGFP